MPSADLRTRAGGVEPQQGAETLTVPRRALELVARLQPAHLLAIAFVFGATVFSLVPPTDPDVWWHVRTGNYLLDGHFPRHDPWSLVAAGRPWVLHEWLAQVVLALFDRAFGVEGLSLYRSLGVATLLTLLAVQCFRRTTPYRAVGLLALAMCATFGGWSERPQLLSWILLVPTAELVRRAKGGAANPWWLVPISYLWANLHGLWVLSVALIGVAVVSHLWEHGWREGRDRAARLTTVAVVCVVAGALTPNGPALLLAPLRIAPYGQFVDEYAAPSIHSTYGLGFFLMILTVVVVLARRTTPLDRYTLLQILFAVVLGLLYIRTLAPAAVILTPLIAGLLRPSAARTPAPRPVVAPALTLGGLISLLAAGIAWTVVALPTFPPNAPVGATKAIVASSPKPRVINEYGIGGWLLGRAPSVRPAIDGRTEIYPIDYVADYLHALDMSGDWKRTIEPLHATATLLYKDTPIVNGLRDELHWRTLYADDTWVVLVPPTVTPAGP